MTEQPAGRGNPSPTRPAAPSGWARRAGSFGAVAEAYDRARPVAPPAALDWIVPAGARDALDVGAGTGLFTRLLAERVAHLTAVEPDGRMRAVLARRSPAVDARDGTAEALPLPDHSFDLVTVSSAWHWVDPARALPEVARVLRRPGRLAVLWTSRDPTVDWVAKLGRALEAAPRDTSTAGSAAPTGTGADAAAGREDGGRDSSSDRGWPRGGRRLEAGSPWSEPETATFTGSQPATVDGLVEQLGTYSGLITAEPAEREARLRAARAFLDERFPGGTLSLPVRAVCWRTDLSPQ